MASNPITMSIPGLRAAAKKANTALLQYGPTIGLVHNTSDQVVLELGDVVTSCGDYDAGKLELANRTGVLRSLAVTARSQAILARENLKPYLGKEFNQKWIPTGYRRSLRTPEAFDALQELSAELKGFYTANPDRQVEVLNLTAARFGSIADDMATASSNILLQKDVVDGLMTVRTEKANKLRRRLRLIFNELEMKLDPLSPHWLAFGFNKPGAPKTPGTPKALHVTLNGTIATLTWAAAARANYYRVWKQVVGVYEDPVALGSPADLLFLVNDLAPNTTVEFSISAVNEGGESLRGKAVRVVVK